MRRAAGFTLLELLVALAIFAVMAVMAYGGLRSVLDTRAATEAQADRLAHLQLVYTLLERDVEQAVARPIRDQYGDPQPALYGGGDQGPVIELTRGGWRNPAGEARSSLERVAYGFADGKLVRRSWLVLDRAQDSTPYEQTLLDKLRSVQVRFLDAQNNWHDSWPVQTAGAPPGSTALPQAVELTLDLEDWGRIRWLFRIAS